VPGALYEFVIAADDRTGAFEVAAELATSTSPVPVVVGVDPDRCASSLVFDLDTRTRSVAVAAARAAEAEQVQAQWSAHKIDSTLRGNWRAELRARARVGGRRLLLVPGWPAMGRTCVDGVVHVDGRPHASVRQQMPDAVLLRDADELDRWLASGGDVAVCDVRDGRMLDDVAAAAATAGSDVLVAGPAGAVGAVGRRRRPGATVSAASPRLDGPALVVCGSATAHAHDQLARLAAAHPDVEIIADEPATGRLVPEVSLELASLARNRLAVVEFSTIVVIGGSTAAALFGDSVRLVGGTVLPGLPWSRDEHGRGPVVVTKAGSFGHPDTLAALFSTGGGEE
jgi:uncharacterized protein YgbK (DUF1537 family)